MQTSLPPEYRNELEMVDPVSEVVLDRCLCIAAPPYKVALVVAPYLSRLPHKICNLLDVSETTVYLLFVSSSDSKSIQSIPSCLALRLICAEEVRLL